MTLTCYILLILVSVLSSVIATEVPFEEGETISFTGTVTDKTYKSDRFGKRQLVVTVGKPQGERAYGKYEIPCTVEILSSSNGSLPKIGQQVYVTGRVRLYEKATNPGQFDYREYYLIQNIPCRLDKAQMEVMGSSFSVLKEALHRLRLLLEDRLDLFLPDYESSLLKSMLLGDKTELSFETKTLFQEGGIIHILAISGLHISLLGMGLYNLLKKTSLPKTMSVFLTIVFMILYGMMTGRSLSARRAVIMFGLRLLAELMHRSYDLLTALSLSAFLMLLENPLYGRYSGFLLSFGAVTAIGFFAPSFVSLRENLPFVRLLPKGVKVWPPLRKTADAFFSCALISLVTLPVLLSLYSVFAPYSLLLNLFVIPLTGVVLWNGLLGLMVSPLSLPLSSLVSLPLRGILWLFRFSCEKALSLPGGRLILGQPKVYQIVLFYVGLVLCVPLFRILSPFLQRMTVLALLSLLLLRPCGDLTLSFADVGQGDGILLRNEYGHVYMIDGGSTDVSDVGKYRLLPFLKSQGISELQALFISHPDKDHISGVLEILQQSQSGISVGALIIPDAGDALATSFQQLLTTAEENNVPVVTMSAGQVLRDGKLILTCLSPAKKAAPEDINEVSLVLLLEYDSFSALLTGDVTGQAEAHLTTMLSSPVTVLKAAHHGSRFSTPEELLQILSPVYTIISSGEGNSYGHPHKELLDRLRKTDTRILRTDRQGMVTFRTNGTKLTVQCFCDP